VAIDNIAIGIGIAIGAGLGAAFVALNDEGDGRG
jgi:hypothetical protein